jgi:hypothetical protein
MFEPQRIELLKNLEDAHAAYYEAAVFGGPSLHFHLRALAAAQAGDLASFSEAAYAMLASWGMHRMRRGGSKMREFDEFAASLSTVWPFVMKLRERLPHELAEHHWDDLAALFFEIKAMATGTSLVGNSKVIAHALPKLAAPVDREYTLTLLFGNGQIRNDKQAEWTTLRHILQHFFYPVSAAPAFTAKAEAWIKQSARFKWDTSPLKVVDNLIIGFQKRKAAEPHDEPPDSPALLRRRGVS